MKKQTKKTSLYVRLCLAFQHFAWPFVTVCLGDEYLIPEPALASNFNRAIHFISKQVAPQAESEKGRKQAGGLHVSGSRVLLNFYIRVFTVLFHPRLNSL